MADVCTQARPLRRRQARADGERVHDAARQDAEDGEQGLLHVRRRRLPRRPARPRRAADGQLPADGTRHGAQVSGRATTACLGAGAAGEGPAATGGGARGALHVGRLRDDGAALGAVPQADEPDGRPRLVGLLDGAPAHAAARHWRHRDAPQVHPARRRPVPGHLHRADGRRRGRQPRALHAGPREAGGHPLAIGARALLR
mmetsp:Transcript_30087/g.71494  ORF Transcript_30087/g.71494 Transcript_30087/m.71494 type:complete len:201 (+) Transcript_30087:422-1024(+)